MVRLDEEAADHAVGTLGLERPPGSLLVKQRPEDGDGDEQCQHRKEDLGLLYQVLAVFGLGVVQPMLLLHLGRKKPVNSRLKQMIIIALPTANSNYV